MKALDDRFRPFWRLCRDLRPVGSRITCSPAPTHTDEDFLVLTRRFRRLCRELTSAGYDRAGYPDWQVPPLPWFSPNLRFTSFRKGEVNLIVTDSAEFFRRFMAASGIAKRLNLLDKRDRVAVFQAVLYGNAP